MSENETQKPWGGKREGSGRPKGTTLPTEKRTTSKSVTLTGAEWQALEALGNKQEPPLTVTKFAAMVLQKELENANK